MQPFALFMNVVLLPGIVAAQNAHPHRMLGYIFVAPGTVSDFYGRAATLEFGVGGEALVYKGLGVGGDGGGLLTFRGNDTIGGFGTASLNGTYHIVSPDSSRKLDPFVTAGYSMGIIGEGIDHGWFNFGGGANYWFRDGLGLRLELRDLVEPSSGIADDPRDQFIGLRVGLTWR